MSTPPPGEPTPDEGTKDRPVASGKPTRGAKLRDRLVWAAAGPPVLAVIGAVLPWFAPAAIATRAGLAGLDLPHAFCWQAARMGFLAPLAVIVVGAAVLGPRLGAFARDQPPRSFGRDGLLLAAAGVFAGVVLALTWLLLPKSYSVSGVSWDAIATLGFRFDRRPQPGFFVSVVAAAGAVVCGVLFVLRGRRASPRDRPDEQAGIIT